MRDHPIAAALGLLLISFKLAAMAKAYLDLRTGRVEDAGSPETPH